MNAFHTFAFSLATLTLLTSSVPAGAQTTTSAKQAASIAVSLAMRQEKVPVGQKPWAVLTVKNIGSREGSIRTDMFDYRVYVKGENAEPPKTSYYRRILGEFQPGETGLLGGGPPDIIPPGGSDVRRFDLSAFYELKKPGKYAVYMEVFDESSIDTWVRTNTADLELEAGPQGAAPQGELGSFSLAIDTDTPFYSIAPGSKVDLTIEVTNTSNHAIRFDPVGSKDCLDVRDGRGEPAPLNEKVRRNPWFTTAAAFRASACAEQDLYGPGPSIFTIPPGKTMDGGAPAISEDYDFSQPGKYTVQLSRFDDGTKTWVKSNIISVTVVP